MKQIEGGENIPEHIKYMIISHNSSQFFSKFGLFFYTCNTYFYSVKALKYSEISVVFHSKKLTLRLKQTGEIIEIRKKIDFMIEQYMNKNKDVKRVIEIMIKEVLRHNPEISCFANLYSLNDNKYISLIKGYNYYNDIKLIPGYLIKVIVTKKEFYLNVDLRSTILSQLSAQAIIQSYSKYPGYQDDIKSFIINKKVKTPFNKVYKVVNILFEKTVNNTTVNYKNQTKTLFNSYKELGYNLNKNGLVLQVKKKDKSHIENIPAEISFIVGLNEELKTDSGVVKGMQKEMLTPDKRLHLIEHIHKLMNEKREKIHKLFPDDNNKENEIRLISSKDLLLSYGITLVNINKNENLSGKIMRKPVLLSANSNNTNVKKPFKILSSVPISASFICHNENVAVAQKMIDTIKLAHQAYGLSIKCIDKKALNSEDPKKWIKEIKLSWESSKYNIIIILIDDYLDNLGFYNKLKLNCNEKEGIITQFIKVKNTFKNLMDIMSNILLQINFKIGGFSYIVQMKYFNQNPNFLIIGLDISNECISTVSNLNQNFTKYYSNKQKIKEPKSQILSNVEASIISFYLENKKYPENVVVYKQGKIVEGIEDIFRENLIDVGNFNNVKDDESGDVGTVVNKKFNGKFAYITVNSRSSLKFFISNKNSDGAFNSIYNNPEEGLIVTELNEEPNNFQFYLQANKVFKGTATPTKYNVRFSNLDCDKFLLKLTYDLCWIYANWKGPIRIPAPLKYAEKLSQNNTFLNESLSKSLSYI